MTATDTTRRTVTEARRAPQWQRLIDSIHKAQEAKGYAGRMFGADEARFFGLTLIGMPSTRSDAAYWVERHSLTHSDESITVAYMLKVVYYDNLAQPHTVAEIMLEDTTPEQEAETATEYVARAGWQTGEAQR